jgi:vancomycin resistance protein VanW
MALIWGAARAIAKGGPARAGLRRMAPALCCGDEGRLPPASRKRQSDVPMRAAVRALMPDGARLAVALARRAWRDSRLRGPVPPFAARHGVTAGGFSHEVVEIVQEIKGTAFREGKSANIALGAALLDGVVIAPGELFSFWRLVGRPSAAAGFALGRSIRGGTVGGDLGGGLCQVSGIAYEAGLRAGLAIVERHPHSRDLYAEEERFTALGLDATIVWPYKDLRLANPLLVPVQLRIVVQGQRLVAKVQAPVPLAASALDIQRDDREGWREVRVVRHDANGERETISEDRYPAPPEIA